MLSIKLDTALDKNALLSTKAENDFKLGVCIMPSDKIRSVFNQNGYRFNRGIDYCVVVDKTCDRLADITQAVKRLALSIKHNDTLSLVTYSDAPQVIFDSLSSQIAVDKINQIQVIQSDSKEAVLHMGLRQAKQLMASKGNERLKKVLLISGLRKTLNYSEESMLNSEIEDYKRCNISIDTLAIGDESNLFVLDNIANSLGGQGLLIDTFSDISAAALQSLQRCQKSIIINVKLKLKFDKYFRVKHMYRGTPTNAYLGKGTGKDEIVININNMQIDKKQYYYFDLTCATPKFGAEGAAKLVEIGVEYTIPSSNRKDEIINRPVETRPVKFTADASKIKENRTFINMFSEAEIKRLESLILDSKKRDEKEAVVYAYNQIITICNEVGNVKLARDYKESLQEFKESNTIVMRVTSESSKSSINDNLPMLQI